ncbi:MAG: efflux RND transporter periplasmic adaptor subunit [Fibrella sp.]|nr:efflux RND transporter periplasmic adaptor subunit [Armatimonadota bacterium]
MRNTDSKRRPKVLLWLLPLVVIAGLIAWRITQKRAEAAEDAKSTAARKNAPLNVEAVPVARRTIIKSFTAVGSIEAPSTVQVSPRVTGRLLEILVREGDRVTPGQVLARIDPRETQANILQREAALAQARSRLAEARVTESSQNVGVLSEVERNQAAFATAQAQNGQARADFEASIATAEAGVVAATERVVAANATIRTADADIVSAKATVNNLRLRSDRYKSLLVKGFVSEQFADNARTELSVQEAALRAAQERRANAVATRDAAIATRKSAERQVTIARNKAKADVAVADASLAQTRATLRAAQANTSQSDAFRENIAALSATVSSAQAELQATRVLLTELTLRSPLEGLVATRLLEPGAVASPTTPVVSVASVRRVWATIAAPEETARRLAPSQNATVTLDALPGETFTGRIAQILPSADPQSRQFTVRVALDNSRFRLRPGTFARVSFITERAANALTVPPEAIKEAKGEKYVLIAGTDQTAQKRTVETGLSDAKGTAVTGDLTPDDKVIVLSQRDVREGQKIRVGSGNSDKPNSGDDRPKPANGKNNAK